MKKTISKIVKLSLLSFILLTSSLHSQDLKDKNTEATKMEAFVSKSGEIVKFVDYNLPDLKNSYGVSETKIRTISSGGETASFYQISKKGKYDTKTASIAYEDLVELTKALQTLKQQSSNDLSLNPDYLENKFVTDDGFKLGYYVSNGKLVWFMVLEKYGSDNIIYIKDVSNIEKTLDLAKQKIESLKA